MSGYAKYRERRSSWGISVIGSLVVVIVFAVIVFAVFIATFMNGSSITDNLIVHASTNLAEIRVKTALHDVDATFENVVFHPLRGPGKEGNSYACGFVRPSYEHSPLRSTSCTCLETKRWDSLELLVSLIARFHRLARKRPSPCRCSST